MSDVKKVGKNNRGVSPALQAALDPRQQRFISLYFDVESATFGNCYQSALLAGYTDETSKNLIHNRPKWLSEKLGQMKVMEPEHLILKLGQIINSHSETTQNKLRAIDMMMKYNQMYKTDVHQNNIQINIQSVLD